MSTTDEILTFYLKQTTENVNGVLQKICSQVGINLFPSTPGALCAIPVYEGTTSLLTSVNNARPTTIFWPAISQSFVQAYCIKFKDPVTGYASNKIVVCTDNYCWARFYAAKELMHCIVDEDGYAASNSIPLVNSLIESLSSGQTLVEAKPQTIVDEVAWLGAAYFLVPTSWITTIRTLHEEISQNLPGVNATLHIAQILRVPEIVLTYRLKHERIEA